MSKAVTPLAVNVVGMSEDDLNLNFIDEFDDVADDFDSTPRHDETSASTPRSEAGSVAVLECKQLLRPNQSRSASATSKRPMTGKANSLFLILYDWTIEKLKKN